MAISSANRTRLLLREEDNGWTLDPSDFVMQEMRITSVRPRHVKNTDFSKILRSDRQRDDLLELSASGALSVGLEPVFGTEFDLWSRLAMLANFTTEDIGPENATVSNEQGAGATHTWDVAFVSSPANIAEDMFVRLKGMTNAGNNGVFRVSGVVANTITVYDPNSVMSAEGPTGTAEIHLKNLRTGTLTTSVLAEYEAVDLQQAGTPPTILGVKLPGSRMESMNFNITAEQILTAQCELLAQQGTPVTATVATSITAPTTSKPMTATANVGTVLQDNVPITNGLQGLTLQISNNLQTAPQVGNKYPRDIVPGSVAITGSITPYLEDITFLNAIYNHSELELVVPLTDRDGNTGVLYAPKFQVGEGGVDVAGIDQFNLQPVQYEATKHATKGFTFQMDLLPA